MVHKLDTLMIYIQPNQLIQAIHTSNLTKHLNHYLMTLCLKKFNVGAVSYHIASY